MSCALCNTLFVLTDTLFNTSKETEAMLVHLVLSVAVHGGLEHQTVKQRTSF